MIDQGLLIQLRNNEHVSRYYIYLIINRLVMYFDASNGYKYIYIVFSVDDEGSGENAFIRWW